MIMEKIDYKHGTFTILNNTNSSDYAYEDYVEWCEMNEIEPSAENSNEFYEWQIDTMNDDFESDLMNIEFHDAYNNTPIIVEGSVGLWYGRRDIEPMECGSVYDALKVCMSGNYDKYVRADWENGRIEVTIWHHDGTHHFTIRPKDKRRKLAYLYA